MLVSRIIKNWIKELVDDYVQSEYRHVVANLEDRLTVLETKLGFDYQTITTPASLPEEQARGTSDQPQVEQPDEVRPSEDKQSV